VVSTDTDTVAVRELLHRDPMDILLASTAAWWQGKRVLITGGGGSIGAPLSERVAGLAPAAMLVIDRDPDSLAAAERRVAERRHHVDELRFQVADVGSRDVMQAVFETFRPDVVLHTAASKHLPLVEADPIDGVRNNLFATDTLAALADQYSVSTFVLLSTDKAAAPSSVMGATKRAAEDLCRGKARVSATRFICVRFGNIIGSSGSVLPVFEAQIDRGGPVTLTHRDVERFFITAEEGIQLVLLAGATAGSGETLVLDAGPGLRIADLAERLIRRRGLVPGEDIEVTSTALRDGEKLREVLAGPDEALVGTGLAGVLRLEAVAAVVAPEIDLAPIRAAVDGGDAAEVLAELTRLVPGYRACGRAARGPGQRAGAPQLRLVRPAE
jgi:FlaA1/EpsC-like NDP-sugar epimerase